MSRAQIFIKNGIKWFEFSMSETGQLDYEGKWTKTEKPEIEGFQELAGSTYFSPSWYLYLQDEVNSNSKIYISPKADISDKEIFAFLSHIGPVLAAVEAKDSMLAGELYLLRKNCFEAFAPLIQYILKPICVEILFSLCYGRMENIEPEEIPLIYNSAKKQLKYDTSKETLEQAFMRYFKEKPVTLTLKTVGTSHHSWEAYSETLEKLTDNLNVEDLTGAAEKIRTAKHNFYAGLETAVQAEPYNPADKNAIAVFIEDIDSKLEGNPGLEKAGYVRALAAKVIREAKPEKVSYNGKLVRLGCHEITMQITI